MTWLKDRSRALVEESLSRLLSPLDARLRKDAIRVVAEEVVAEQRQDFDSAELLVASLARVSERCIAEIERLEAESASLLLAYQQALDESERQEVLRRHLVATRTDSLDPRRDLAAVGRWLDIEAMRERYASRVSRHVDETVICYDSIAGLVRAEKANYALVTSIRRSGLLLNMLEHTAPRLRAPIRCAALRTLTATIRQLTVSST
jgi:hypothetical protein